MCRSEQVRSPDQGHPEQFNPDRRFNERLNEIDRSSCEKPQGRTESAFDWPARCHEGVNNLLQRGGCDLQGVVLAVDVGAHRKAGSACPSHCEITMIGTPCICINVPQVCRASCNRIAEIFASKVTTARFYEFCGPHAAGFLESYP